MPDVCAFHVAPPSVVATITPPAPTAQPAFASANATALRSAVVSESCGVHVAPPSVVATMTPPAPTAQPWCALDEGDAVEVGGGVRVLRRPRGAAVGSRRR